MATGGGSPPPPPGWDPNYPTKLDSLDPFYSKISGYKVGEGKLIPRLRDEKTKRRNSILREESERSRAASPAKPKRKYGIQNFPRSKALAYIDDTLSYADALATGAVMDRNDERVVKSLLEILDYARHIRNVYFHDKKIGLRKDFGVLIRHLVKVLENARANGFDQVPMTLMETNSDIVDLQYKLQEYQDEIADSSESDDDQLDGPYYDQTPPSSPRDPTGVGYRPGSISPPKSPKPKPARKAPPPPQGVAPYSPTRTPPLADEPIYANTHFPNRDRPPYPTRPAPSPPHTPPYTPTDSPGMSPKPKPARKAPPPPKPKPKTSAYPPPELLPNRPYQFPPHSTPSRPRQTYIDVLPTPPITPHTSLPGLRPQVSSPIHKGILPEETPRSNETLVMERPPPKRMEQPAPVLSSFETGSKLPQHIHGQYTAPTPPSRHSSLHSSQTQLPEAEARLTPPLSPQTGRIAPPLRAPYQREPHRVSSPQVPRRTPPPVAEKPKNPKMKKAPPPPR